MPYAGGVYSVPPGTQPTTLTPIDSSDYSAFVDDIEAAQNAARPVGAGGTGAQTVIGGWDALAKKGTDIATASSINLTTATGPSLTLTGTTTVTAVTLAEGSIRVVRAAAAFQITASSSLLCNGSSSVNLPVAAEDTLIFRGGAGSVVSVVKLGGTYYSGDASAAAGPLLDIYRDSASPAANDLIGEIDFNGKNSTPAKKTYASVGSRIDDATAASEDATLLLAAMLAGTLTNYLLLGANAQNAATANAVGLPLGQISFPATQNPSSDANTLDDYEEGTWTPAMTFGGSATGVTFSNQGGRYVKIGQFVFFTCTLTLSNNGSGTGAAVITGLPFTNTTFNTICASHLVGGGSSASGIYGIVTASNTTIELYIPGATAAAAATDTNCTNSFDFRCSGSYRATA